MWNTSAEADFAILVARARFEGLGVLLSSPDAIGKSTTAVVVGLGVRV